MEEARRRPLPSSAAGLPGELGKLLPAAGLPLRTRASRAGNLPSTLGAATAPLPTPSPPSFAFSRCQLPSSARRPQSPYAHPAVPAARLIGPQDSMSRRKHECAKGKGGWRGSPQPFPVCPSAQARRTDRSAASDGRSTFMERDVHPTGRAGGRRSEACPFLDIELARADRSCPDSAGCWCEAGARPRGSSPGLCATGGFPGGSEARTPGWPERGRTSHSSWRRPGCGRCGGPALSSEQRIPSPKTGWAPGGRRTHLGWPS